VTSVLDQMVAGTGQQKRDKAATLTPVGTEKGGPLDPHFGVPRLPEVPEVFLTQEAIGDIAKDLRRQAGVLLDVADGLDRHLGREAHTIIRSSEAPSPDEVRAAQKELEKAADAAAQFAAQFSAQQAEAQAAVFQPAPEAEAASGGSTSGWTCPTHGADFLNQLTSRKGRKYLACESCTEFEK
jgi:hypothetical protein